MAAPVIITAFAPEELPALVAERKAIAAAMAGVEQRGSVRLLTEPNAGLDDLFRLLRTAGPDAAIFHYGGHANGQALLLAPMPGETETAHAAGLAQLLGQQPGLQLVFLNGCATQGQVQALLDAGVPAVVATRAPVEDERARETATGFYQALAAGSSIGEAWATTMKQLATSRGAAPAPATTRGRIVTGQAAPDPAAPLWGLWSAPGTPALDWRLPRESATAFAFAAAPTLPVDLQSMNQALARRLFPAFVPFSRDLQRKLEDLQERGAELDWETTKLGAIDSLPLPIGEGIRGLLASTAIDLSRLSRIAATYATTGRLLAYVAAGQLWEARIANPALALPDGLAPRLLAMVDAGDAVPDWFDIARQGFAALAAADLAKFMPDATAALARIGEGDLAASHQFLQALQGRLADPALAEDLTGFAADAQQHLGNVLADCGFLARYQLMTVREVLLEMTRLDRQQPRYRYRYVALERASTERVDNEQSLRFAADTRSVIMVDRQGFKDWLNLSPFVVDWNAIRRLPLFDLFLLDGLAGGTARYRRLADANRVEQFQQGGDDGVVDQLLDFRRRMGAA